MNAAIVIRKASSHDLHAAKTWLSDAGLPSEDLTASHMQTFLIAMHADQPAGMIGLENFGELGLLRSLVIENRYRGAGIGRKLVDALETNAASEGIAELWLLTIDADAFFNRLGYVVCERDDAPAVIRNTQEFSTLCPGDAVLMMKGLQTGCLSADCGLRPL